VIKLESLPRGAHPTTFLLAAVVACAWVGAAAAALSPRDYRAQANAICKRAKAQIDAIPQPKTKAQLARALGKTVPIGRAELAGLRKLDPPPSLKKAHERALGYLKTEIDLLAGAVKRIHAGTDPTVAFNAINERGTKAGAAEDAAWKDAGASVCGSG
jgi:hypothetical protein